MKQYDIIVKEGDAGEVAAFLRALADAVEGGDPGRLAAYGVPVADFEKIKVALRRAGRGALHLKVKVRGSGGEEFRSAKRSPAVSPPQDKRSSTGKLAYKRLKKRMAATFALLGRELASGVVPQPQLAADFKADGQQMVAFPGRGEPHYPEFTSLCQELAAAVEAGDIEAARIAHGELARLKKACHARYK